MTVEGLAIVIMAVAGYGAFACFSRRGAGWKGAGVALTLLALTPALLIAAVMLVLSQVRM